jgi:hypothetical protein
VKMSVEVKNGATVILLSMHLHGIIDNKARGGNFSLSTDYNPEGRGFDSR